MKAVSRNQSNEIGARVLRNTDWGQLDGLALQKDVIGMSEVEFGRRFSVFLKNGANFVMKGPSELIIDRSTPFDTRKFLPIWRGPKDGGGLKGDEEQDARSLILPEIDFKKVLFTNCLKNGETTSITGEEKLARHLAAGHIRLDAKVGECLIEEKDQAILEWLYRTFGITWFELPGTILRYDHGRRQFLTLSRSVYGVWRWGYLCLDSFRRAKGPGLSAVLVN